MVSEQLQTILQYLLETVKSTQHFVVAQAPDVVRQLLYWQCLRSFLLFLLFMGLWIISAILIKKTINLIVLSSSKKQPKWLKNSNLDIEFLTIVGMVVFSFINIISIIGIACHFVWVEILIAPKWYIVEYLINIVKTLHQTH